MMMQVMSVVTGGGRPPVDGIDDVPRHMKELMKSCWDHTVSNRPNFKSVSSFRFNQVTVELSITNAI